MAVVTNPIGSYGPKQLGDRLKKGVIGSVPAYLQPEAPPDSSGDPEEASDWDQGRRQADLDNPFVVPGKGSKFLLEPVEVARVEEDAKDASAVSASRLGETEEAELVDAMSAKADLVKKALWEIASLRVACQSAQGDFDDEIGSMLGKTLPPKTVARFLSDRAPVRSLLEKAVFVLTANMIGEAAGLENSNFAQMMVEDRLGRGKDADNLGRHTLADAKGSSGRQEIQEKGEGEKEREQRTLGASSRT